MTDFQKWLLLGILIVLCLMMYGCGFNDDNEIPDSAFPEDEQWSGEYRERNRDLILEYPDHVEGPLMPEVLIAWERAQECVGISVTRLVNPLVIEYLDQDLIEDRWLGRISLREPYTRIVMRDRETEFKTTSHEMAHLILHLSRYSLDQNEAHESPAFDCITHSKY